MNVTDVWTIWHINSTIYYEYTHNEICVVAWENDGSLNSEMALNGETAGWFLFCIHSKVIAF